MQPAHLELWGARGTVLVLLEGPRLSIGRAPGNDVVIDDSSVSRSHAVIEAVGAGWCVRDLGSRNGTLVNGARLSGERALRPGDQLRVGNARLVFRSADGEGERTEDMQQLRRPVLTRREREVLVELCRPLSGRTGSFREPATVREMARALSVTEAAVKQHLLSLYDKFGLHDPGSNRRLMLANAALDGGAVTPAELSGAP